MLSLHVLKFPSFVTSDLKFTKWPQKKKKTTKAPVLLIFSSTIQSSIVFNATPNET